MLLTVVLLRGKDFVEVESLKGICHNKMYTAVGYNKIAMIMVLMETQEVRKRTTMFKRKMVNCC